MSAVTEATSAREVSTLVRKAITSYGRAQETVQAAAVAIILHAQAYGDCSQAKVLARGVPARERNSLIGYFSLYSPIGVALGKTAADDKCRFIRSDSKNYHDFNIDGAKANMWYDDPAQVNQAPRPLNTILDFYQVIDRMLKKAIKDAETEGKYEPEQAEAVREQAEQITVMINKFRAKNLATAMEQKVETEQLADKTDKRTNAGQAKAKEEKVAA